jgi:hypothetical protein
MIAAPVLAFNREGRDRWPFILARLPGKGIESGAFQGVPKAVIISGE